MAHFYLDNDTSPQLIPGLQALGHEATHTRHVNRRLAPDDEQLIFALERGWPIVSHNYDDYLLLHRVWHNFPPAWGHPPAPPHPWIILIRQTSPANALVALTELLTKSPLLSMTNQVYWWDGKGAWQHLPDTTGSPWQLVR